MMTISKYTIERVGINDIRHPDEILSTEELEKYSSFKVPKRQKEWLAGRFAAKAVIGNFLNSSLNPKNIPITYDLSGRPVCLLNNKKYLLSITHSGDWAGAVVKNENCSFLGMDIEKIEVRSKFWIEDYFHKEEVKTGSPEHLTKLWTIKESVLKALGLGLTANLLDIKIDGEIKFFNKALQKYEKMGKPKFDIISERFYENYYQSIII